MNEKDIKEAYLKIRKSSDCQVIPDAVIDLMKEAALEKVKGAEREFKPFSIEIKSKEEAEMLWHRLNVPVMSSINNYYLNRGLVAKEVERPNGYDIVNLFSRVDKKWSPYKKVEESKCQCKKCHEERNQTRKPWWFDIRDEG